MAPRHPPYPPRAGSPDRLGPLARRSNEGAVVRLIGGVHGGRRLLTPKGDATRPTTDRVRESLFSQLAAMDILSGARVADLFAGSGGLALEALSRGATSAVLVDSARAATRVIASNIEALNARDRTRIVDAPARTALAAGLGELDLVFLDPPYPMSEAELAATLALLCAERAESGSDRAGTSLAPGAVVVVERSAHGPEPSWPPGLECFRRRSYGETVLYFAEPSGGQDEARAVSPVADAPVPTDPSVQ